MDTQPRKLCSFCWNEATELRSGESDIFDCCAECAVAWDGNPEFLKPDLKIAKTDGEGQ